MERPGLLIEDDGNMIERPALPVNSPTKRGDETPVRSWIKEF
jgi:hypothetical protein